MTTRPAQAPKIIPNGNGSSVAVLNTGPGQSGNVSAFDDQDGPIRPAFTYLASAYPAAKVDDKGRYWALLHIEFSEVPEPVLKAAVKEYVHTNDNAYRLPTVAELLKLSRKYQAEYDVEQKAERQVGKDAAQQQVWEAHQNDLRRVTQTVPQEDREEIAARIAAAFEATDDWLTAARLIYSHLLDTDGPHIGWYSPTVLIADGIVRKLRAGRPTGDPSSPLPEALVAELAGQYPGRFKARYSPRVEPLLDPDRLG